MIKSTHFALQISANVWLVTFVSDVGLTETRRLTAAEFAEVILGESKLGDPDLY